jgi:hypothetical protein
MISSAIHTADNPILMDNWQVKIQDVKTEVDKLWLIVRYVLTK